MGLCFLASASLASASQLQTRQPQLRGRQLQPRSCGPLLWPQLCCSCSLCSTTPVAQLLCCPVILLPSYSVAQLPRFPHRPIVRCLVLLPRCTSPVTITRLPHCSSLVITLLIVHSIIPMSESSHSEFELMHSFTHVTSLCLPLYLPYS